MTMTMRSSLVLAAVLAVAAPSFGCSKPADPKPSTENPPEKKGPPQAEGMILLLTAAKKADAAGFKSAFSKRLRDDPDQSNWEKNVGEAQANLQKMFGDYRVEDFTFAFKGDDTRGTLTATQGQSKPLEVAVVKEAEGWKVDER